MSAPLSPEQRVTILAQLGDARPAADGLLKSFGQSIADRLGHEHGRDDWFCTNLAAYMGEHAAPVLRRLLDAEARVAELEQQLAAALGEREVFLAEFENDEPRLFLTLDAAKDALTERRRHDDPLLPWDWFPDGEGLWVQWRCDPDTDRPVALLLGSVMPLMIPAGLLAPEGGERS